MRFHPFILLFLLLPACFGQDDIADSIRQLGAADFRLRRQAKAKLLEIGFPACAALQQAAGDADFERAVAAREILEQLLPGVAADTPENVSQAVSRYVHSEKEKRKEAAAMALARCRPFPLAVFVALQEWEVAEQQHLLASPFIENANFRLQLLLAGREDLLQQFLFAGFRTGSPQAEQLLAIYLQRGGRLEAQRKIIVEKLRGTHQSTRFLHWLHWAANDLTATRALLEKTKEREPDLYLSLLQHCGNWETLAPLLEKKIEKNDARSLLMAAAAYELAGDDEAVKRIHGMLAEFNPWEPPPKSHRSGMHYIDWGGDDDDDDDVFDWGGDDDDDDDDIDWGGDDDDDDIDWGGDDDDDDDDDDGIDWGDEDIFWRREADWLYRGSFGSCPEFSAWKMLCLYGLPEDATKILEKENSFLFLQMLQSRWFFPAADQLCKEKIAEKDNLFLDFFWLAMLYDLGEPEIMAGAQKKIATRLEALLGKTFSLKAILYQLHAGSLSGELRHFMLDFLDEAFAKDDPRVPFLIFALGGREQPTDLADFWFRRLRKARPAAKNSELALLVHDFLAGRLEDGEREKILNLPWTTTKRDAAARKEESRILIMLIQTCLQLNLGDEAIPAYRRLGLFSSLDPDNQIQAAMAEDIAKHFVQQEEWAKAMVWFRKSFDLRPKSSVFAGLTFSQLRVDPKNKEALKNLQIFRLAMLDDRELMEISLNLLGDFGLDELFKEELDVFLQWNGGRNFQRFFPDELVKKMEQLRNEGKFFEEYQLVAAHWLCCLEFCGFYSDSPSQLLAAAVEFRAARARYLYFKGEDKQAFDEVKRAIEIMPAAVKPIGTTVRALDTMGKTKEADKVFALSYERHRAIIEKLPNCASILNGLAWLCSLSNHRLEKGRDYARRAVKLQSWNDVYLNILAELEFQLGNREAAEKLNAECRRLNPRNPDYRVQQRRFRKK